MNQIIIIEMLLYFLPSVSVKTETLTGQKVRAQLYSTFLSSSKIITQLLLAGLKKELHLLPFSEMGKFQTIVLNFGGWKF